MKFLNNNEKSKLSIKNDIPKAVVILFSLTIIICLTINILMKRDAKGIISSSPKETARNINLWLNSKFNGHKDFVQKNNSIYILNDDIIKFNDKNVTLENISLNKDKLHLINDISPEKYKLPVVTSKKSITLTPIHLFNTKLPFYRKVNITESPLLSFMSELELFYSINMLIILSIIITVLIIAVLYKLITHPYSKSIYPLDTSYKSEEKNTTENKNNFITADSDDKTKEY